MTAKITDKTETLPCDVEPCLCVDLTSTVVSTVVGAFDGSDIVWDFVSFVSVVSFIQVGAATEGVELILVVVDVVGECVVALLVSFGSTEVKVAPEVVVGMVVVEATADTFSLVIKIWVTVLKLVDVVVSFVELVSVVAEGALVVTVEFTVKTVKHF